jgi:hypothetical protein
MMTTESNRGPMPTWLVGLVEPECLLCGEPLGASGP